MLKLRSALLFFFYVLLNSLTAQHQLKPKPEYQLFRTTEKMRMDGLLDEAVWQEVPVATDFVQNFPSDTLFAKSQTEVMLAFDDTYLYIGVICHDTMPGWYVAQSLLRDYSYDRNDAFAIYIDPLNDKTNGFNFTLTPLGVQREGLISNGGGGGASVIWDNKWFSAAKINRDNYTLEMAIPFKSLRYDPEVSTWGLNLTRNDLKRNEKSSWAAVPRNFYISTLGYEGTLKWMSPPPKAGKNLVIIPYLRTSYQNLNTQVPNKDDGIRLNGGGDAKIGVTSSLNLDITVNPDFSDADVDDQVINLERFNIFFPERRNFFQENSDLFGSFGFSRIRPFFSRQIGLDQASGKIIPIYAGARLSGKLNSKWRIGAMSMQTAARNDIELLSQNFTVAAVQRQLGKASNIGALIVNKQAFDSAGSPLRNDYARNLSLDYNFATLNNRWRGKLFYQKSLTPEKKTDAYSHASWLLYNTNKWNIYWNHEYVSANFTAETGYLQRSAYWRLEPGATYYLYPKNNLLNRWGPFVYMSLYTDLNYKPTENLMQTGFKFEFQNLATAQWSLSDSYVKLLRNFNATGVPCDTFYKAGSSYRTLANSLSFSSNYRKTFSYNVYADYGGYYTGSLLSYGGVLRYRWQPYMVLSMKIDRREIKLPDPYCGAFLTIVGPRAEITFSRSLFLTTYLQYNNQAQNVNLNTRLQWRFKPMSDLFIVYNSNYNSADLLTKGQRLIIKLNWWINV